MPLCGCLSCLGVDEGPTTQNAPIEASNLAPKWCWRPSAFHANRVIVGSCREVAKPWSLKQSCWSAEQIPNWGCMNFALLLDCLLKDCLANPRVAFASPGMLVRSWDHSSHPLPSWREIAIIAIQHFFADQSLCRGAQTGVKGTFPRHRVMLVVSSSPSLDSLALPQEV